MQAAEIVRVLNSLTPGISWKHADPNSHRYQTSANTIAFDDWPTFVYECGRFNIGIHGLTMKRSGTNVKLTIQCGANASDGIEEKNGRLYLVTAKN